MRNWISLTVFFKNNTRAALLRTVNNPVIRTFLQYKMHGFKSLMLYFHAKTWMWISSHLSPWPANYWFLWRVHFLSGCERVIYWEVFSVAMQQSNLLNPGSLFSAYGSTLRVLNGKTPWLTLSINMTFFLPLRITKIDLNFHLFWLGSF